MLLINTKRRFCDYYFQLDLFQSFYKNRNDLSPKLIKNVEVQS